jgi:hypothetical protein
MLELARKKLRLPLIDVEGLQPQYVQTEEDIELVEWQGRQALAHLEEKGGLKEADREKAASDLENQLKEFRAEVTGQQAGASRVATVVIKPWTAHDRNLALEASRDNFGQAHAELMKEHLLGQVVLEWENLLYEGQPASRPTVEELGELPRGLFDKLYQEAARISEPSREYIAFLRARQSGPSKPDQATS